MVGLCEAHAKTGASTVQHDLLLGRRIYRFFLCTRIKYSPTVDFYGHFSYFAEHNFTRLSNIIEATSFIHCFYNILLSFDLGAPVYH